MDKEGCSCLKFVILKQCFQMLFCQDNLYRRVGNINSKFYLYKRSYIFQQLSLKGKIRKLRFINKISFEIFEIVGQIILNVTQTLISYFFSNFIFIIGTEDILSISSIFLVELSYRMTSRARTSKKVEYNTIFKSMIIDLSKRRTIKVRK